MPLAGLWVTLALAVADWVAVGKAWKRLEYIAKPAVIVALLLWLLQQGIASRGWPSPLVWFALGLVGSLAGDVLLMLPERLFLPGLVAFLLGHIAYIVGLNAEGLLLPAEALLVLPVAVVGGWLLWQVSGALAAQGHAKLRGPVALYTAVISLMVVSALATLFRPGWAAGPAALVSVGALLFFASDGLLAWNRFVASMRYGKLLVIIAYHLGQAAIVAGAVLHARG